MKSRTPDKDIPNADMQASTSNDENFLSRWSRRKHEAQQGRETPSRESETLAEPVETVTHLTDADMPPLESLTEDSDYSGFLSPKVSEALRKQALRKLFHSAGINVRDGLDDYDEDFTEFAKLGDIVTAEMRHRLEREMQQQVKAASTDPSETTTPTVDSGSVAQSEQSQEPDDDADSEEIES